MFVNTSEAATLLRGDDLLDGATYSIYPAAKQRVVAERLEPAARHGTDDYVTTLSRLRALRRSKNVLYGPDIYGPGMLPISDRSFELAENFLGLLPMHSTSFRTGVTICNGVTLHDLGVAMLTVASNVFTTRIAFADDGSLVASVNEGKGEYDLPTDNFDGDDIPHQLADIFARPAVPAVHPADQDVLAVPVRRSSVPRGLDALHAIASPASGLYDGLSDEVIAAAARLLDALPRKLPRPQLSASDEGEMGFSWFANGNRFEAMISPEALAWISVIRDDYRPGEQFDIDDKEAWRSLATALSGFYDDRSAADHLGRRPVPA